MAYAFKVTAKQNIGGKIAKGMCGTKHKLTTDQNNFGSL